MEPKILVKKCTHCKVTKPVTDFYRKFGGQRYALCKECQTLSVLKRRKELSETHS